VRSHPRLHAKIYATDKFAIIGSSNASSNGLAIEGQPESWIEANVISDDPAIVGSAFALFQEIWDSPETSKITNAALTEAKKLWDNRPKQPRVTATSLLAACREQPELFEAVYLAVYDEGLGPEGSRKLKDFKKSQRENDIRNAWGYQFEVPEGAWLIDFDCIRNPIVHGYARVTSPLVAFEADGEPDLVIAIKQRAIISDSLHSFKLSRSEKLAVIEKAELLVSQDSLVPLKRVVQLIDEAR
jgi:PLD-like domain